MILTEEPYEEINIYLCEDNEEHLSQMADTVKLSAEKKGWEISLHSYLSAEELLKRLENEYGKNRGVLEVIFADIEMPGMNGIELGKRINQNFPEVYFIFTTAFEEYAIQGYEARAYRYLLKPVTLQNVSQILEQILKEKERNKIVILREEGKEVFVALKEIIYISAEDKYTVFHTRENTYFDKISLTECEKLLGKYGFYRIHRKYIINMKHHKKLGTNTVVLSGAIELPVSRKQQEEYRKYFISQLENGMLE